MITVTIIPILKDNYSYLIETVDGTVCIVDPGEAEPIIRTLEAHDLELDLILNTHHHSDHTAGNAALKERYNARILGPEAEADKIKDLDDGLNEDIELKIGQAEVRIIETPGHTAGGICYYFKNTKALFCGDTLFSMGCGRLFEGTPEQMWDSMRKILTLPNTAQIYPGHEYTQSNGEFCLSIEPDNQDIKARMHEVTALRSSGQPTIPVTLEIEKKTNVFLRTKTAESFAELRQQKDEF